MAKKINPTLLLLNLIICLEANSQILKTYSGNYEHGSATYQYYENKDYERIFNGNFSYRSKAYDISYYEQEINGYYKENLKHGLWTAKKTRTLTDYRIGKLTVIEMISGRYEYGEKVGQWIHKVEQKLNDKTETVNTVYNFKANILVGDLNLISLKGQLNDNGLFIGNWNMTTKEFGEGELEYIATFQNNIFLKLLVRKSSDGKILLNYNNSDLVNQISDTIDEQILIINDKQYEIKSCSELDRYSIDDNKYFYNFKIALDKKIWDFDEPFKDIPLGSSDFIIKIPQVLIQKELTYAEKRALLEEKRKKDVEEKRIAAENAIFERERLEAISRKEKFEEAVKKGNLFFETKKYKEALEEYNSANEIEVSIDVKEKIKTTKEEIYRINTLQKKRSQTYSYIKSRFETLSTEMISLKISLEKKKKNYGQNYESCMNLLSSNFKTYFLNLNEMFNTNKTSGLKIEDTWNETDQNSLDLLMKFNEEFILYENFHNSIKSAFEIDNKDKLKLLKSLDDPKEIISKF